MNTKTTTSDFAIVVYPWASPYLDPTMSEAEPYLLDRGPHYVSYSRSKTIGGTLQIDAFGRESDMDIGDWVVLKSSSKEQFTRTGKRYLEQGTIKFIGQLYTKSSSHFADAEGNLRTSTQYVVREWDHIFHIQVKFDILAASINAESNSGALQGFRDAFGQDKSQEEFEKYISKRYSPFDLTKQMLRFIDAISKNEAVVSPETPGRYRVSTRLPVVPSGLYEDNIETGGLPGFGADAFDKETPWSTGFLSLLVGVQDWKRVGAAYTDVFRSRSALQSQFLELITDTRPITLTDPRLFAAGESFVGALETQFANSGLYEFYTDLFYFGDSKKCAPTLVVRDKPVSYSKLYDGVGRQAERDFGWTYIDKIPRTTISPASVVSISVSNTAMESPNFIRYNLDTSTYEGKSAEGYGTRFGAFANITSQRKFGSVENERVITAYITHEQIQFGSQIDRQDAKKDQAGQNRMEDWFKALSTKMGNYYPNKFLFPKVTVYLKDDDYPVTVGMAVRVPLSNSSTALVGLVSSISGTYKIEGDGKRVNETYIELEDCAMEDTDKTLMPMPRALISNLIKHRLTEEEKAEVLRYWSFKAPGSGSVVE